MVIIPNAERIIGVELLLWLTMIIARDYSLLGKRSVFINEAGNFVCKERVNKIDSCSHLNLKHSH
jgi:hypothetical protein